MEERDTLLIVDDRELNRAILRGLFEKEYNLLEAANGEQALVLAGQYRARIAAVLLDLVMPVLDGYAVLGQLRDRGFLIEMPVVVITADDSAESEMRAFDLGAADIVSKPFAPYVVKRRVHNLLELYRHKNHQQQLIERQAARLRGANEAMVDALSSIIEYRSAETGQHVQRIRMFTRVLLEDVARCCPEYGLDGPRIEVISSAAAMHDIGKIAIPDSILNKPGPLTSQEFEVMETHTVKGCEMLAGLEKATEREYLQCAYNICRYHHERWDGAGYPEGLAGDAIPLAAQVVGVADCYDALTTDRVYKKAIAPERAFQMLLNGECGQFSPRLLESFKNVRERFAALARQYADSGATHTGEPLRLAEPEPPSRRGTPDIAVTGQLKYLALLRYLGATVMEADLAAGTYHVVYLASSDFEALKNGGDFAGAVRSFAQAVVHPDDRPAVLELLGGQMQSFLAQGVPRRSRTYRVLDRNSRAWVRRQATLLRIDMGDPRQQKVLLIWQELESRSQAPGAEKGQTRGQQALSRLLGGVQQCRNDQQYTLLHMSAELRELLGYTKEELAGQFHNHYLELVYPPDRDEVVRQIRAQLAQGNFVELEYRIQAKGGRILWMLEKSQLSVSEDGEETLVCVMIDVTRTRRAEEELRRTLERHRIILEQTNDVIFEWDIATDRMEWSGNWKEKFGYEAITERFSTRTASASHAHPKDLPGLLGAIEKVAGGVPYVECELRLADAGGSYRWCRARVTTQFDDLGRAVKAVGVLTDVDEERRATQALKERADKDELTGVYNRRAGRRRIERLLAQRESCGALLVLDIDDFKQINDTYGHMFGDAVLQNIAAELRSLFRSGDVVSRIGGDEFLIYMAGAAQPELITARLEKLLGVFRSMFLEGAQNCSISCSVGAALYPEHGQDYDALFQRSDQALYAAKAKGKDRYALYEPAAMEGTPMVSGTRAAGTRIESEAEPAPSGGDLVSEAFHLLSGNPDLDVAVNAILALVGNRFGASRAYIFEDDPGQQSTSNTYEWCAPGVEPQQGQMQHYPYKKLGGREEFLRNFNEQGVFYCPGVAHVGPRLQEILRSQGIRSMLQCAIRDEGGFKGFVGFDDCIAPRMWVKEQIEALAFVAKLVSVSLLKKRAEEQALATARELRGVLDHQDAWVYVVEPASLRLEYLNEKVRTLAPGAEPGMLCHQALLGRDDPCESCPARSGLPAGGRAELWNPQQKVWAAASYRPIRWSGRPCWLLTCQDITPYKKEGTGETGQ